MIGAGRRVFRVKIRLGALKSMAAEARGVRPRAMDASAVLMCRGCGGSVFEIGQRGG